MMENENGWEKNACLWSLVAEFVKTSLMQLTPGKLRLAYAQHSAQFFDLILKDNRANQYEIQRQMEDVVSCTVQRIINAKACLDISLCGSVCAL